MIKKISFRLTLKVFENVLESFLDRGGSLAYLFHGQHHSLENITMLLLKESEPKARGRGLNWKLQKCTYMIVLIDIHVHCTAEQCMLHSKLTNLHLWKIIGILELSTNMATLVLFTHQGS